MIILVGKCTGKGLKKPLVNSPKMIDTMYFNGCKVDSFTLSAELTCKEDCQKLIDLLRFSKECLP